MPFGWNRDSNIRGRERVLFVSHCAIKTLNWDILPNKTIVNIQLLSNLNHFEEKRTCAGVYQIDSIPGSWMNGEREKSVFARNENVWPFFLFCFVGESNKHTVNAVTSNKELRLKLFLRLETHSQDIEYVCRQRQTHIYSCFIRFVSNFSMRANGRGINNIEILNIYFFNFDNFLLWYKIYKYGGFSQFSTVFSTHKPHHFTCLCCYLYSYFHFPFWNWNRFKNGFNETAHGAIKMSKIVFKQNIYCGRRSHGMCII